MEDEATDDYLDQCMKDWADLANEYAVSLFDLLKINNNKEQERPLYVITHDKNLGPHILRTLIE